MPRKSISLKDIFIQLYHHEPIEIFKPGNGVEPEVFFQASYAVFGDLQLSCAPHSRTPSSLYGGHPKSKSFISSSRDLAVIKRH